MSNRRARLFVLRWHRRVGVAIVLLVVLLAVTGVALNHTEGLELDSRYVSASWAQRLYGVAPPAVTSFALGEHYVSGGAGRLYFDVQEVERCDGGLDGAVALPGMLVALCDQQLVLLSSVGELIERFGLPGDIEGPVTDIGSNAGRVVLRSEVNDYRLDPDTLLLDRPDLSEGVRWPVAAEPPAELLAALHAQLPGSITLERLLLDLHSGRLPGRAGVWVMDLAAILLLLIALGGCWIWLTKPGRWLSREVANPPDRASDSPQDRKAPRF